MNKLTERLLAEGYSKDNHPDYVSWVTWGDFEYTLKYLSGTVWETPCGLLKQGIDQHNYGSHLGVDYCPENDNPRYGCPYYDELPCPHRFPGKLFGWNCAYHKTDKEYDYEKSVEKIWSDWDAIESQALKEMTNENFYCACLKWNRYERQYEYNYFIEECIKLDCKNEVCSFTKKKRDFKKVNIYYDISREFKYKIDLLDYNERSIEKGVKVFKKAVPLSEAKIWLKQKQADFPIRKNRSDRENLFFTKMHGDTGFDKYDYFYFTMTAQNIRIESRESRDLAQDLADISEGFKVVHASDIKKQTADAKRERKIKRKEAKIRRNSKEKDPPKQKKNSKILGQISLFDL